MEKNEIRLLNADEIECRVSVINDKGLSLLLYKDARVDQKILDETFGIFRWKRSHQCINGSLYCTVEIYDEKSGTWVAKQDVGTTGFAEKEKSLASDSFKRACFNWGIGRELYSAPFIWIPANKTDIRKKEDTKDKGGGKYYCNDRFRVSLIGYNNDREINELKILNSKGNTVYELKAGNAENSEQYNSKGKVAEKGMVENGQDIKGTKSMRQKESQSKPLSSEQINSLRLELERTGVTMEAVKERYQIQKPEGMNAEQYSKVMSALSKTKSAKAA